MSRPSTRVCYLCGREYGTTSIGIHIPQCQKKWLAEERKKPAHQQRPLPGIPKPISGSGGNGGGSSSGGKKKGKDRALNEDSMSNADVHAMNDAAMQSFNTNTMMACQNCGRTFLPDRLPIHMRSCSADRPAKSVEQNIQSGSKEIMKKISAPGKIKLDPNNVNKYRSTLEMGLSREETQKSFSTRPSTTSSVRGVARKQAMESAVNSEGIEGFEEQPLDSTMRRPNTMESTLNRTLNRRGAPRENSLDLNTYKESASSPPKRVHFSPQDTVDPSPRTLAGSVRPNDLPLDTSLKSMSHSIPVDDTDDLVGLVEGYTKSTQELAEQAALSRSSLNTGTGAQIDINQICTLLEGHVLQVETKMHDMQSQINGIKSVLHTLRNAAHQQR